MPGPALTGNVLDQTPVAPDQQMGRDAHRGDGREIGVCVRIEPVEKERVDPVAPEFARRQADIVDHQQVDRRLGRAGVLVRRGALLGTGEPAIGIDA